jgi:hypothetical protein
MNKSRPALTYFVLFLLLFGCKNTSENFKLGDELVDVKSDIVINDTSTIRAFTIKSDSIVTSGVSAALVGQYFDGTLGNIGASSYFRLAVGSFSKISTDPLIVTACDSLCLILNYSKYSYGDTMQPYTLEIHRLSNHLDSIIGKNGYRYNNFNMKYDPDVLGQATFVPRPRFSGRISIPLSESVKNNLFDLITNKLLNISDATTKQSIFEQNFHGIALVPPTSLKSSSVIGYKADNTNMYLLFYLNTTPV